VEDTNRRASDQDTRRRVTFLANIIFDRTIIDRHNGYIFTERLSIVTVNRLHSIILTMNAENRFGRLEVRESRIQNVVDQLNKISHDAVRNLLDAKLQDAQAVDPKAGIVITPLTDIQPLRSEIGQEYSFYAARVLPANPENPNYVNPHYHLHGDEPYRFLAGTNGEMNTGRVRNNEVVWNISRTVQPNDTFEVQEGEVHSFRNLGKEPYDFTFACPPSHLEDYDQQKAPDGDRYFTKNMKKGIPPWYPKSS
jgi:mannose-6-phosphate isomerase-like protein (cupin superfamily)